MKNIVVFPRLDFFIFYPSDCSHNREETKVWAEKKPPDNKNLLHLSRCQLGLQGAKRNPGLWWVGNIFSKFENITAFIREGVRLVAHEVAMPRIECQEKEMEPLCIPENCQLKNSNTDCLTTDIPTEVSRNTLQISGLMGFLNSPWQFSLFFFQRFLFQVKLEDQVCEICQEGRTKLRPVVIQVGYIFLVNIT